MLHQNWKLNQKRGRDIITIPIKRRLCVGEYGKESRGANEARYPDDNRASGLKGNQDRLKLEEAP